MATLRTSPATGWAVVALLICGLAAGLFGRFYGLGDRPLAVDEYFFVQSVGYLLQHGLPEFPTGGYYVRGLLPQYLTAASELIFGPSGMAQRLPTAIFSLAGVWLGYVYSARFVSRPVAVAIALTLLVSSWHIEFARFARMYSIFQVVTLLFLLAVDDAYFRGLWRRRYLPHVLAGCAVMSHGLGILLVPFLFVPLAASSAERRFPSPAARYRFAAVGIVTAVLCLAFVKYKFRSIGVSEPFPADFAAALHGASLFAASAFPFWSVSDSAVTNVFALVAVMAAAAGAMMLVQHRGGRVTTRDILLVMMLIATLAHAFMVSAIILFVLLFRFRLHRRDLNPARSYVLLGCTALAGLAWLAYALSSQDWFARVDGAEYGLVWSLRRVFFGWPNFYDLAYRTWLGELPVMGAFAFGSLVYLAATRLAEPWYALLRQPWLVFAYVALCFGVLQGEYASTRYWFFIYPVMLATIGLAIDQAAARFAPARARTGACAAVYLVAFAVSGDFNPSHIARVGDARVAYRMSEYAPYAGVWYDRLDYRSPAAFLDRRLAGADGVRVVLDDVPPVSYYLRADHAVYHDRAKQTFTDISRLRGTVDIWSNRRLLSTAGDLRDYAAGAREIWIVGPVDRARATIPEVRLWAGRAGVPQRMCLSVDGRLEVVRIRFAGGAAPAGSPGETVSCADAG